MINVTKPFLPPIEEFEKYLKQIWDNNWITNSGPFHQELEQKLCDYLKVKHISLFNNGTIALITALQALGIKGEVITTPFTFVATSNSLLWNNCTPVFVDVDNKTGNIDPKKIEAKISKTTSAILAVHVYGIPCEVQAIQKIATKHNLNVIYDAAHGFGVEKLGESILNYGDLSILSFHATKVFNTIEGGAIVSHSLEMKQKIDRLKNFGFIDETTLLEPGINGKMNELQASMGLIQLKYIDELIQKRKDIALYYQSKLEKTTGIRYLDIDKNLAWNYSYFPIFIDESFKISRDNLYEVFKKNNINVRRYFYPLLTSMPSFNKNNNKGELNNAEVLSSQVICLPIYPDLTITEQDEVLSIING